MGEPGDAVGRPLAAADGAGGPGAAVPGRGVVDRRDPRGDGRPRSRPDGRRRPSGSARRCARGRGPSPTSTGRRGRWPARCTAEGVAPGDVVVFQLPNWVEAGITFWAAAYLGAVVVPIVHFYGPKEVEYILRTVSPAVVVTADRFGHNDYLATYAGLLSGRPGARWLVVGDRPSRRSPAGGGRRSTRISAPIPSTARCPSTRMRRPSSASPRARPATPRGSIHSHRTIGCEARQLDYMFPTGGPPQITGAPVGHFIGMLNAFLVPLLRDQSVNLIDVWDPAAVLRMMRDEGLGVGGGATYFLTSLLDHPDFTPEHLALMPFAGLGGSAGAGGRDPSGHRPRDQGVPLVRQHRAPVDHRLPARRPGGQAAHHRRSGAARRGGPPRRGRPDPQPRARLLRRLHRPRADRRRRSTRTAGTAPATWACSTTTATSPSPTASPTSSSGAARTSAPPRSRSC